MCGICGIVRIRGADADLMAGDDARVSAMVDALAHRGPDGTGQSRIAAGALGATRLAVRGVGAAPQPFVDDREGIVAVCNGEIDNHRELREWLAGRGRRVTSSCDVAVIPALYAELGDAFVERLVGVFALAVWDARRQRVLLARDRAGERHLFYTLRDGTLTLSSEIAALATGLTGPIAADAAALGDFLRAGYFAAPATPLRDVARLAPGERAVIDGHGVRRQRYWRWPVGVVRRTPSLDRFDGVFREAVRRQSDVDVPWGVFLSGGVDSSLVAAVARSVRPDTPLTAYTVRFAEASYDEGADAERMARHLGMPCVPAWLTPERVPDELRALIARTGEPLADPAWIPAAVLARRAAEDVKVALVGEGADELFGGYPTYLGALFADRYAALPRLVRAPIRGAIERWPVSDRKVSVSFLLKRFVAAAETGGLERHREWTAQLSSGLRARLGVPVPMTRQAPDDDHPAPALLDLVQRYDLERSLADGLLVKADRASMASGLELRAPFLDLDVMRLAAELPPRERVRGLTTKVFLKRYAERYLPRETVHRRKRGLSVPLSTWLRGPLHEWAASRVSHELLSSVGISTAGALGVLAEHVARRADHARALWTLIVLSEWLEWLAETAGARSEEAATPQPASAA
jgi:asparagine synthase (glutamine-hydrolysing)